MPLAEKYYTEAELENLKRQHRELVNLADREVRLGRVDEGANILETSDSVLAELRGAKILDRNRRYY
jgi:hypothetical protein